MEKEKQVKRNEKDNAKLHRLRRVVGGFAVAATLASSACLPRQTGLSPETVLAGRGNIVITASDYDAIAEGASRFGVNFDRFGTLAICESEANANNTNGSHDGLYSQSRRYWTKRVSDFTKATGISIDPNIRNPRSNALVSAWMISARRNSPYSKSHNGLPSDWQQCYAGWMGSQGLKSQTWYDAKARLDQLNPMPEIARADALDLRYEQAATHELAALHLSLQNEHTLNA